MRILVIGAGVIGVTSAYRLATDGHQVMLLDKAAGAASGASGANAGLLSIGDSLVWSTPSAPKMLAQALLGGHAALQVTLHAGWRLVPWGIRFLAECRPERNISNTRAVHALSLYSYTELERLLEAQQIDFRHQRNGMVFLLREKQGIAEALRVREVLARAGEHYEVLSPAALSTLDPGYEAAAQMLAGAVYVRGSGHGDCSAFTHALLQRLPSLGVDLQLGRSIEGFDVRSGGIRAARISGGGEMTADVYVLSAGAWSRQLAHTAGVALPITPSAGFSATVPVLDDALVPEIGGVDEGRHVAFSHQCEGLRLSSTARFAGYRVKPSAHDYVEIRRSADELFPGALNWDEARYGHGLRPAVPSGRALIGPASCRGLYVNAGHGHLGWTQACGSAALLGDLIAGRTPAIDPRPYQPEHPISRR